MEPVQADGLLDQAQHHLCAVEQAAAELTAIARMATRRDH
jgi:hypothetical protein